MASIPELNLSSNLSRRNSSNTPSLHDLSPSTSPSARSPSPSRPTSMKLTMPAPCKPSEFINAGIGVNGLEVPLSSTSYDTDARPSEPSGKHDGEGEGLWLWYEGRRIYIKDNGGTPSVQGQVEGRKTVEGGFSAAGTFTLFLSPSFLFPSFWILGLRVLLFVLPPAYEGGFEAQARDCAGSIVVWASPWTHVVPYA